MCRLFNAVIGNHLERRNDAGMVVTECESDTTAAGIYPEILHPPIVRGVSGQQRSFMPSSVSPSLSTRYNKPCGTSPKGFRRISGEGMYMTQRGVATVSAAKTRIGSLLVSRSTAPFPGYGTPLLEIPAAAVEWRA